MLMYEKEKGKREIMQNLDKVAGIEIHNRKEIRALAGGVWFSLGIFANSVVAREYYEKVLEQWKEAKRKAKVL